MKHSIRVRFAPIFAGLMATVLIGTRCANNRMLEEFYTDQKVSAFQMAYEKMDRLMIQKAKEDGSIGDEFLYLGGSGEQTEATRLMGNLNDKYGITIVIIDSSNNTVIDPATRGSIFMMDKVRQYTLREYGPGVETLVPEKNYTVQRAPDIRPKSFYLESQGYYPDSSTIFIMPSSLASIRENVGLVNRFPVYVGVGALPLARVVLYFATKKVTPSILELANLSEKMSNLGFEAKYADKAQDETGVLGNSMNVLSDRSKQAIGELKMTNNELQNDIEQKIQIDEMQKDFIASVSHELKMLIALIQGYVEGPTEDMVEEQESYDYYCEVIMDEADKMNKMVYQLLTLTALEFGNDAVEVERFDIAELIEGVISSASILVQQKEAHVEFDDSHSAYMQADELKIEKMITSYLNNVLNHLDEEKVICIRFDAFPGNKDGRGRIRIFVFNSGSPIPGEDLPNVWTRFYKVDKARIREYNGNGIGLSVVKAITNSHHQERGVRNLKGGVEFWFTLDGIEKQKRIVKDNRKYLRFSIGYGY